MGEARRPTFPPHPRRAIRQVTVVEDASAAAGDGRRESATRIRGLTYTGTVGTEYGTRLKTFAVCHGRQPGLVIELSDVTQADAPGGRGHTSRWL